MRSVIFMFGAAAILAACVGLVLVIRASRDPSGAATLVQGVLAPVTIAITLLGALGTWWFADRRSLGDNGPLSDRRQLDAAADQLSRQMTATWHAEAQARGIELPAPATIRWHWAERGIAAPREHLSIAPPPGLGPSPLPDLVVRSSQAQSLLESGIVTSLYQDLYARLPHGRLVLLGPPGAGKTAAMILLLLAVLDDANRARDEAPDPQPVPIWLTLSGWNPRTTSLCDWVCAIMVRNHRFLQSPVYGPDAPSSLFHTGRVALFLDGLDEMSAPLQGEALRQLDVEASHLRVVITSRLAEYQEALAEGWLHNAAVVELLPPTAEVAAEYLVRDQGIHADAWNRVAGHIASNQEAVTASALSSPLMLSLARAVYRFADPSVLADPGKFASASELRRHLLSQFLVSAYPDAEHRAHATHWLAWIAYEMRESTTLRWWDISSWVPLHRRVLVVAATLGPLAGITAGITASLSMLLGGGGSGEAESDSLVAPATLTAVTVAVTAGLSLGLAAVLRVRPGTRWNEPQVLTLRRVTREDLPMLRRSGPSIVVPLIMICLLLVLRPLLPEPVEALGVWTGAIFGLVAAAGAGLTMAMLRVWRAPVSDLPAATAGGSYIADGRAIGLGTSFAALTCGLTSAVANAMSSDQGRVPAAEFLSVLVAGTIAALAIAVAFDARAGCNIGLMSAFSAGIVFASVSAAVACVAVAVMFGLLYLVTAGASFSLRIAEVVLWIQGRRHVRFNRLLQDALARQVLRQAGSVYQFRHAELQAHLAQRHEQ